MKKYSFILGVEDLINDSKISTELPGDLLEIVQINSIEFLLKKLRSKIDLSEKYYNFGIWIGNKTVSIIVKDMKNNYLLYQRVDVTTEQIVHLEKQMAYHRNLGGEL